MKGLSKRYILFLLCLFLIKGDSFYVCKYFKINVRLAKRNTERILLQKRDILIDSKGEVLESFSLALNDNLVNEALYIMKYYNISNDDSNPYLYIIMYEMIYFGFKILRMKKYREFVINFEEEDTNIFLKQMIINITIYLLLKKIMLHNFILINK